MFRKTQNSKKQGEKPLKSDTDMHMDTDAPLTLYSVEIHEGNKKNGTCTPGDIGEFRINREQSLRYLNPKKGKVKTHKDVEKIRGIFDTYAEMKPIVQLHESFNFNRMFWEFCYNFFHFLAFPVLIARETKYGLYPREFLISKDFFWAPIFAAVTWTCIVIANIIYCQGTENLRLLYFFPITVMNLLFFVKNLGMLPSLFLCVCHFIPFFFFLFFVFF